MKFLRNLLATIVGLFVFTFIMIIAFIFMISSSSEEPLTEIEDNSVIHLKLDRRILEREQENPLANLPISGIEEGGIGLIELKETLAHAKDDPKIKGILLETPYLMSGISSVGEIRSALADFKESGKFLISYSEMYSEGGFYLASVADKVYLNPDFSYFEYNGLNMERVYYKGLLEKLEIEPLTFKVGDYKEISEPFDRKDMSDGVKMRNKELIDNIYNNILNDIAASRNISFERLRNISDSSLVGIGPDALKYKLIDDLLYKDQVDDMIKEKVGLGADDDINYVSYQKYRKSFKTTETSKNKIAVIIASGEIVMGKGDNETIGSQKFVKEISKARKDDNVKAIVLRINSPGGSALASDVLWREIRLAAEAKPVIASMSDLAASGGYYMAMGCDTIVAQKNTITGSIGVFSIIFNAKGFLNNKLGITTDNVQTGQYSDIYSMTKPLNDYEKRFLQEKTDEAYKSFISKAAEGRHMTVEEIEPLASGRIWTGEEALKNGLVDAIGDLDDAVQIAAKKAGIKDDYKLKYYPFKKSAWEEFISSFSEEYETKMLKTKLGEYYPYVEKLSKLKDMEGIQARSLFEITF